MLFLAHERGRWTWQLILSNDIENKYVLTREQYDFIMRKIREQMRPDEFCRGGLMYQVNTIYYDTPDFDVIRRCNSSSGYKEKLRMRCYGTLKSDEDKVFVCIKKKLINEGNKRRAVMKLCEAKEFLATGKRPQCTRLYEHSGHKRD